tara:strand:- start:452 stop:1315 length:864 start_codon:yes stop_codon:yes gene_type:complete
MPILSKGTDFTATEQVTSTKLDDLVDGADFTDTSGNAVDSSSTTGTCVSGGGLEVTSGGQLQIKDSNVTKAKIENLANYKVLGNVSGGAASPAEVAILDQDTMSGDSATSLATQQSIKAYVDTYRKPNLVTSTKLDAATLSVTKSTYADFPTLETAVTSRFQNTKFMVTGFISMGFTNQDSDCIVKAQYKVGSGAYQDFNLATGASNRVAGHFAIGQNNDNNTGIDSEAFSIPTPAITNSAGDVITFKLQVTDVNASRTLYINREEADDSDDNSTRRVISTLTVQEI